MRWTTPNPQYGDTRVRECFLLFPKSIGGEVRWLETAIVKEKYYAGYVINGFWLPIAWVSK